jgi:hypothetical protein
MNFYIGINGAWDRQVFADHLSRKISRSDIHSECPKVTHFNYFRAVLILVSICSLVSLLRRHFQSYFDSHVVSEFHMWASPQHFDIGECSVPGFTLCFNSV